MPENPSFECLLVGARQPGKSVRSAMRNEVADAFAERGAWLGVAVENVLERAASVSI